jgi:hypothetical protein
VRMAVLYELLAGPREAHTAAQPITVGSTG